MTEKINKGCEFQSDCIEYKDISYLKVMPICAIYELSIACHHTVDRCKYYKLYKQLKRLEQKKFALTQESQQKSQTICELEQENKELKEENKQHIKEKQILHERLYCYAYEKDCHLVCKQQNCLLKNSYAYRSALEVIQKMILSAWEQGKYLDGGLYNDLTNEFAKINEVLE